jgi:hypothetical protein
MKFSIGYNHDINMLKLLDAYKYYIEALYFPIPQQYTASGRALRQPKSYRTEVLTIIKRCNALHIMLQLLIKSTCEALCYHATRAWDFSNRRVYYTDNGSTLI